MNLPIRRSFNVKLYRPTNIPIERCIYLSANLLANEGSLLISNIIELIYQSTNLSTYQFINLSNYQSINLSIYHYISVSTYQSINLAIYHSIKLAIYQSINPPTYQRLALSIYPSTNITMDLLIYQSTHLSIYRSTNL